MVARRKLYSLITLVMELSGKWKIQSGIYCGGSGSSQKTLASNLGLGCGKWKIQSGIYCGWESGSSQKTL